MVFSSLFFLYVFLALHLLIYTRTRTLKKKNLVLLVSSLIFYAWAGPRYLLLLIGMTLISYFMAIAIENFPDFGKYFMILECVCLLGLLGFFKYTGFLLSNLQALTGWPTVLPEIVLPIGISFYTFQLLSYVADVYRGQVEAQRKFHLLLLYASLFHQCIAGPIVRYQDVRNDITHRRMTVIETDKGIRRFCTGLAKKAVLANGCAAVADTFLVIDDLSALSQVPAAGLWLGALFYMLEIYLDFSAYSDMAIGMGLMIGFHYKENFDYPYVSSTVTEFWRRWHISLGSFFRDYVYIPLGGNRRGTRRTMINLFVVWFLTGMWHGASWNYILWGLYYFAFLVLEKNLLREKLEKLPGIIGHIYTLVIVYFGWVLFKCESLSALGVVLKGMLCLNGNALISTQVTLSFRNNIFFLLFCLISVTPLLKSVREPVTRLSRRLLQIPYPVYAYDIICPVVLLVLSTMALVGNSYNPFLYFQF